MLKRFRCKPKNGMTGNAVRICGDTAIHFAYGAYNGAKSVDLYLDEENGEFAFKFRNDLRGDRKINVMSGRTRVGRIGCRGIIKTLDLSPGLYHGIVRDGMLVCKKAHNGSGRIASIVAETTEPEVKKLIEVMTDSSGEVIHEEEICDVDCDRCAHKVCPLPIAGEEEQDWNKDGLGHVRYEVRTIRGGYAYKKNRKAS